MAHHFANAYTNVKSAVDGLLPIDALRTSLNHASAQFALIDDGDFDKAPYLRAEFRSLRVRLRRNPKDRYSNSVRYLDNTDSIGMIALAEDLLLFSIRMDSIEFKGMIPPVSKTGVLPSLIRDPGPDNWDEDRSLD